MGDGIKCYILTSEDTVQVLITFLLFLTKNRWRKNYYPYFILETELYCSLLAIYSGNSYKSEQLHLDCMNLSAVATKPSSGGFISEIILSPIYKKLLTTSEHLILITMVNWDAKFCRQL